MKENMILLAKWLAASGMCCLTLCGCMGWRSGQQGSPLAALLRPKVQGLSNQDEVEFIPEKLSDPMRVKLSYARWMEEMNHSREAREHYAGVIAQQPENVDALLGLARLDQLAGNLPDAERRLLHATKVAPENSAVQYAWGHFLSKQGRWSEAVSPLQKAMYLDPHAVQYRHELAVALVHTGDVTAAIPHFAQTVGDSAAHYNVALILGELGNWEQAERQLTLSLAKNPQFEPAQRWLAEVRRQRGAEAVSKTNSEPAFVQPVTGWQSADPSVREPNLVPASGLIPDTGIRQTASPVGHSAMMAR